MMAPPPGRRRPPTAAESPLSFISRAHRHASSDLTGSPLRKTPASTALLASRPPQSSTSITGAYSWPAVGGEAGYTNIVTVTSTAQTTRSQSSVPVSTPGRLFGFLQSEIDDFASHGELPTGPLFPIAANNHAFLTDSINMHAESSTTSAHGGSVDANPPHSANDSGYFPGDASLDLDDSGAGVDFDDFDDDGSPLFDNDRELDPETAEKLRVVQKAQEEASAQGTNGEFACPYCEKSYNGKHARSIWRRHLQDKHAIPLSQQPRRTRWDGDANRPKNAEERRQRMLESKRKWARKKRLMEKNGQDGTPAQAAARAAMLQQHRWEPERPFFAAPHHGYAEPMLSHQDGSYAPMHSTRSDPRGFFIAHPSAPHPGSSAAHDNRPLALASLYSNTAPQDAAAFHSHHPAAPHYVHPADRRHEAPPDGAFDRLYAMPEQERSVPRRGPAPSSALTSLDTGSTKAAHEDMSATRDLHLASHSKDLLLPSPTRISHLRANAGHHGGLSSRSLAPPTGSPGGNHSRYVADARSTASVSDHASRRKDPRGLGRAEGVPEQQRTSPDSLKSEDDERAPHRQQRSSSASQLDGSRSDPLTPPDTHTLAANGGVGIAVSASSSSKSRTGTTDTFPVHSTPRPSALDAAWKTQSSVRNPFSLESHKISPAIARTQSAAMSRSASDTLASPTTSRMMADRVGANALAPPIGSAASEHAIASPLARERTLPPLIGTPRRLTGLKNGHDEDAPLLSMNFEGPSLLDSLRRPGRQHASLMTPNDDESRDANPRQTPFKHSSKEANRPSSLFQAPQTIGRPTPARRIGQQSDQFSSPQHLDLTESLGLAPHSILRPSGGASYAHFGNAGGITPLEGPTPFRNLGALAASPWPASATSPLRAIRPDNLPNSSIRTDTAESQRVEEEDEEEEDAGRFAMQETPSRPSASQRSASSRSLGLGSSQNGSSGKPSTVLGLPPPIRPLSYRTGGSAGPSPGVTPSPTALDARVGDMEGLHIRDDQKKVHEEKTLRDQPTRIEARAEQSDREELSGPCSPPSSPLRPLLNTRMLYDSPLATRKRERSPTSSRQQHNLDMNGTRSGVASPSSRKAVRLV